MTTGTTLRKSLSSEDFKFEKHGIGGAGVAAKMIAQGLAVSFDCYKILPDVIPLDREFVSTHYFGLLDLKENIEGRSIALMASHSSELDAVNSHSLIPSWTPKEITSDPVYIAAALVSFLKQYDNYFLNP